MYRSLQSANEQAHGFLSEKEKGEIKLTVQGVRAGVLYDLYGMNSFEQAVHMGQAAADPRGHFELCVTGQRLFDAMVVTEKESICPVLFFGQDVHTLLWLIKKNRKEAEREKEYQKNAAIILEQQASEEALNVAKEQAETLKEAQEQQTEITNPLEAPVKCANEPEKFTQLACTLPLEAERTYKKPEYVLRVPSEGRAVDALPELAWPDAVDQFRPYFLHFMPIGFSLPASWRCVRVRQNKEREYILGRKEENEKVSRMLFAYSAQDGEEDEACDELLYGIDGRAYLARFHDA